jgi:type II secretory pathway predicted ATPase ExeA
MMEAHLGLKQRPFRSTPDSACYYPATTHERALARLLQALADQEGIILLTAEPGLGKTLLCQVLLERLGDEVTSAFLTNSHCGDRLGLLQSILYELSLPHEGRGEQDARLALTDFLLRNFSAGRKALLIVDEAQHLTPDLLEELRLLSNLEARSSKALQVVLVAQPEIADILGLPGMAGLRQRIAVRLRLAPLPVEEAADYLLHRVRIAGGRPDAIFADEALELLARGTQGVPRLLNQAASQALLLAHEAAAAQVDAEAVLEALAILGLELEEPGELAFASVTDDAGAPDQEDSGPLLSLADAATDPLFAFAPPEAGAIEPGQASSESSMMLQPKRPA